MNNKFVFLIVISVVTASCTVPDVSKRGQRVFQDGSTVITDRSIQNDKVTFSEQVALQSWPISDFYSEIGPINHKFSSNYEVVDSLPLHLVPRTSKLSRSSALTDWSEWLFSMNGRPVTLKSPVIFNNTIVVSDKIGNIAAANLETYEPIWEFPIRKEIFKDMKSFDQVSITYGNDSLYLATNNGYIISVNPETGYKNWFVKTNFIIRAPVKYVEGKLYGMSSIGEFFILSAFDGALISSHRNGDLRKVTITQPAVLIGHTSAIASYPDGTMISFDLHTGTIRWVQDLSHGSIGGLFSFQDIDFTPIILNEYILGGSTNGSTYLIKEETGEIVWERQITVGSQIAASNDYVFFIDEGGNLIALQWKTGLIKWTRHLKINYREQVMMAANKGEKFRTIPITNFGPILANGKLVVFAGNGKLLVFDPQDGNKIGSYYVPYHINGAAIVNGYIYAISQDEKKVIKIS